MLDSSFSGAPSDLGADDECSNVRQATFGVGGALWSIPDLGANYD